MDTDKIEAILRATLSKSSEELFIAYQDLARYGQSFIETTVFGIKRIAPEELEEK